MESLQQRENTVEAKRLKRKFTGALLALLITFLAVASATYAWYIYNTSQHTTNVRMAAGAGVNLQISNAYNGVYGSSAVLVSYYQYRKEACLSGRRASASCSSNVFSVIFRRTACLSGTSNTRIQTYAPPAALPLPWRRARPARRSDRQI